MLIVLVLSVVVLVVSAGLTARRRATRAPHGEPSIYHQPGDGRPAGPDAEAMREERMGEPPPDP
jgi:hypothetical protein